MRDSKIDQKQSVVKEIAALLDDASSAVVVNYRGLTTEQDIQLRKQLRGAGVVYKVHKNTMVCTAAKDTDSEKFDAYLEGSMAFAVGKDDTTVATRVSAKFVKTAPKLEIKGGIAEGAAHDAKRMAVIAAVPSREELLSRLFGSMRSPITDFARVIKQIAERDAALAAE